MDTRTSPTTLICSQLAVGWQTAFDISVVLKQIGESGEVKRTWNGQLVNLADPAFKLFEVSITSGDGDMRPPALSDLWVGDVFEIVPTNELSSMIAPGDTSRTLIRPPYAGSIRCFDLSYNAVPFTLAGQVLSLAAPAASTVRIYYRPVLQVMVTEPWSITHRERHADVSWSLSCAEVGGTP